MQRFRERRWRVADLHGNSHECRRTIRAIDGDANRDIVARPDDRHRISDAWHIDAGAGRNIDANRNSAVCHHDPHGDANRAGNRLTHARPDSPSRHDASCPASTGHG